MEKHLINGVEVTAIQLGVEEDLTDFLDDYAHKISDPGYVEWLDGLDNDMWIVKRGPVLIEVNDMVYQALFHGAQ